VSLFPIPLNERERLAALYRYAVLDTPAEACFDQVAVLASQLCETPIALITFVDRDRLWIKSRVGVSETQLLRKDAFCSHAIVADTDLFIVEDAARDSRFAAMRWVRGPWVGGEEPVRFYAGAPLRTSGGVVLGSLCVLDRRPRLLTAMQENALRVLAHQVCQQLELRHAAANLRRHSTLLDKTERTAHIGGWELNLSTHCLSWTDETYRIHGLVPGEYAPDVDSAIAWYAPGSRAIMREAVAAAIDRGTPYDLELQITSKGGTTRWVRATGQREDEEGLPRRLFGTFQDITERRQLETEILTIAQREQATIGVTLHEGLGQELTGVSFLLHGLAARLPQSNPELTAEFSRVTDLVRDAIGTCRSLAQGLSPTGRERGGLIAALQSLAARTRAVHGVHVSLRPRGEDWTLDTFVAEHLYRIAQEAVMNALKHASPESITLSLDITAARTQLCISDDGRGAPGNAYAEGIGLQIIRYRARLIGAKVSIEGMAAGGTRVRCRVAADTVAERRPLSGNRSS
jgi:PAS domain S-box-containing protein